MDKKCSICKEVKPVNEFFKKARNKDGYHSLCKVCHTSGAGRTIHGSQQRKREEVQELLTQGKIKCNRCKTIRPLDMFIKDKYNMSGYHTICQECHYPGYYEKKKEKDELLKAGKKKCNKCNAIKSIDDFYGRMTTCKSCHSDACLRGRFKYQKKYNEYQRKWSNERLQTDPEYKLRRMVSRAIRAALKSNDGSKEGESVTQHLPYTIEELKEHIESQFQEGMTWDNNAADGWHIDHIYPQSKLPYDSMDHPNFQKCWALENLQPLWAKENIKKGSKIL